MADEKPPIELLNGDAWRAAAAEAYKRAGVCIVDRKYDDALACQKSALVFERNSYMADSRPPVPGEVSFKR